MSHYLAGLADIARLQDDAERAGRLEGAAQNLREASGNAWLSAMVAPSPQVPAPPSEGAFQPARARGREMSREHAIQYALGKGS
jgi:hypothetical protein